MHYFSYDFTRFVDREESRSDISVRHRDSGQSYVPLYRQHILIQGLTILKEFPARLVNGLNADEATQKARAIGKEKQNVFSYQGYL